MRRPAEEERTAHTRGGESRMERLYRAALHLLPPAVREADGDEMAWAFGRLWEEASGLAPRIHLTLRAFGRLPWVAVREWMERLRPVRLAGRGRPPGHGPEPWRPTMSPWSTNLRLALRTLRKAPAFTLTVVILLGLGVGAVTTIFTVVDHVVLRPLPYPEAGRLFMVENGSHSGPMLREFQEMRSVEAWGFVLPETANLVGEGDPLRIQKAEVSRDFFSLFGARPAAGRLFVEEDFGAPSVAVLSHGLWERAFGSDPEVVGRTIRLNDAPVTVVGVLSRGFLAPEAMFHGGGGADVWLPFDWRREALGNAGYHAVDVVGRSAPGATLADVDAELDRVLERLAQRFPDHFLDPDGHLVARIPPAGLQEITARPVRAGLGLLLGSVALLLLVASLNVANLVLARGLGRIREMAVRRALGAGTSSLVKQLLVENLLLGVGGALLGLGLASLGLRTFLALNPTGIPRGTDIGLDARILAFGAGVSLATVLVFGLIPALRSMGRDLTEGLKGVSRAATAGRGASRTRSGLVVAEVALSLVLVASAGLLLRSFLLVQDRDPGFRTEGIWTVPLTPSWITSAAEYVEAMDRVEASLAAIPGVTLATYSLTLPFEMTGRGRCCWMTRSLAEDGRRHDGLRLLLQPATESYFETLGVSLLAGRGWTSSEGLLDPWPVVLSERLAVEVFGSAQDAVSRRMEVGDARTVVEVMGVAADTRHFGLDEDPPLFIYLPMERLPFDIPMAHMAVQIRGDPPAGWAGTLRQAVWTAVPDMPVPTVRSMEDWVDISTAGRRFDSVLFGSFGGLALLLAAAGLYGTLLFSVGERRRELGIRMALGAAQGRVQRQVVTQGLILAALGCGFGMAAAWAGGRFLQSRLYEVQATDPPTLVGAVAVLLGSAILASWLPARRAARLDPMEVLREE